MTECHRHPDIADTCPHATTRTIPGSEARDEADDTMTICTADWCDREEDAE